MQVQAIACLACGHSEQLREDSQRLIEGQWPAWRPGPQPFPCPKCNVVGLIWATEPHEEK